MRKIFIFKRQRFMVSLIHVFCIFLILLISGCGGGGDDNLSVSPETGSNASSETGSAVFTVSFHNSPVIQASENSLITAQAEAVDCGIIDNIICEVYDGSNTFLTSETFECSAGEGTIDNIPVGTNRIFVILGEDTGQNILYHGEATGDISAGQTTDVGTIDAYPFVPTGVSATAISSSQINLSWDATEDVSVTGYNIYRNGSFLRSVTSTSTSDTGLSQQTQYCYTVAAHDAAQNESGQSSPQVCATTFQSSDIEAPTIPTGVSATSVSSSQINLSWIASTDNVGVTGYNIYRDGSFLKSVTSISTSDTGLSPSTQFCYTVSAYDSAQNESSVSVVECQTTQPDEPPSTPTGLTATAVSTSQIDLSWNASTDDFGVVGYNIYQFGELIDTVTSTFYSDTNLSSSVQYCYTVSSVDTAQNESGQSSQDCATTSTPQDTTPPTPDPMTWSQEPNALSNSSITMVATTALDLNGPIEYTFDFVNSPTNGPGANDSGLQSSTTYTDSGLGTNQQYGYRVRASDGIGNVTSYSVTSYAYTFANRPGYPSGGPFSNVTETSIRVNWEANGNPPGTEYYIENIDNGTNSGWTTNLYWDSTGLSCGTSYEFRVMARNGDRIVTPWLNLDNQFTQACPPPGPPTISDDFYNLSILNWTGCLQFSPDPIKPGSLFNIYFHYKDPDGDADDKNGATVQIDNFDATPFATFNGDGLEGDVSTTWCVYFGVSNSKTLSVTLTDGAGRKSNTLDVTISKPVGAN